MNVRMSMVDDLVIKQRHRGEFLGVCPCCGCSDANFNTEKLVWRCFDKSSLILTREGYKTIDTVLEGDMVLSEFGKFNKVVKTFKNKVYKKATIISKQLTRPIICTPDHILYVQDGTDIKEKCAEELKKGDILVYPVINDLQDRREIVVDASLLSKYFGDIVKYFVVDTDDEFLRVSGLYIAEGSASYGQISFAFNSNEKDYIKFVEDYFSRKGFSPRRYMSKTKTCTKVTISSVYLSYLFGSMFGYGCTNKKIPLGLMTLPINRAKILLKGILDGDGYNTSNDSVKSNRLGQTSEILCMQVKEIASYCGYSCSGYLAKNYYKDTKKPTYINWISDACSNNSTYSISRRLNTWFNGIKVDTVVLEDCEDYFYDLAIEDSHKYTVNGVLVHNCWHCYNGKGRIIPEEGYVVKEVEQKVLDVPKIREFYKELTDKFHSNLPVALEYLKARGFKEKTLNDFRIGFCSADYYSEYANSIASDAGVISQQYPLLSNRVTIPYIVGDEVTDIRGRMLETLFSYKTNTPKYLSLSGNYSARGANFLFNHDVIKNSSTVLITEGEFKAMAAVQNGFPCVATAGIGRWDDRWVEELKGKEVILIPDNEASPGKRKPGFIMARSIGEVIKNLKVAFLPLRGADKTDLDTFLEVEGLRKFEIAVKGALNVEDYLRIEDKRIYGKRR